MKTIFLTEFTNHTHVVAMTTVVFEDTAVVTIGQTTFCALTHEVVKQNVGLMAARAKHE